MSFTSLAAALPLMQGGKIKAVAVTSRERMPQLPDVAPLSEGAPGLGATSCSTGSPSGTAGTPPGIHRAPQQHHQYRPPGSCNLRQAAAARHRAEAMKVAEFKSFVDAERTKFGKIVEQANIKLSN